MWTGAYRKQWCHDNHVISLKEPFSNTNSKWPVNVALLNFSGVVSTESIWYVFRVKMPFISPAWCRVKTGSKSDDEVIINLPSFSHHVQWGEKAYIQGQTCKVFCNRFKNVVHWRLGDISEVFLLQAKLFSRRRAGKLQSLATSFWGR